LKIQTVLLLNYAFETAAFGHRTLLSAPLIRLFEGGFIYENHANKYKNKICGAEIGTQSL
jgi:hypothetical protein